MIKTTHYLFYTLTILHIHVQQSTVRVNIHIVQLYLMATYSVKVKLDWNMMLGTLSKELGRQFKI